MIRSWALVAAALGAAAGDRIAFVSASGSTPRLMTVGLDGRAAVQVVRGSDFAWSPDGKAVAYTAVETKGPSLWIARADRRGARRLVAGGRSPAWSPDGRWIAFVRFGPSNPGDLWLVRPGGPGVRRLTSSPSPDDAPAWSPDGRRLAFVRGCCSRRTVFVIRADGTLERRLALGTGPRWSPDGRWIAYLGRHDAPGNYFGHVYLVRPEGGRTRRLTSGSACHEEQLAWSKAGRLAFAHFCDDRRGDGVEVIDTVGKQPRLVAPRGTSPAWSPDGAWIAFVRDVTPANSEIFVVRADGSTLRRLTRNTWPDRDPAWQPRPQR